MMAAITRGIRTAASRPRVRLAVQALVSLSLIAALISAAQGGAVRDSLKLLRPETLALAAGLQVAAFILNSWRWQLLLRHLQIRESLIRLTDLYFIGSFCSLFLPSSAGGDAVRIYEVARRSGRTPQTIVATLQERILGLGASLFLGLVATLYYLPLLPTEMRLGVLLLELGGATAAVALLFPAPLLRLGRGLWQSPSVMKLTNRPMVARLVERLRPLVEVPSLSVTQLVKLCAVALVSVLFGMWMCSTLAAGLGMDTPFLAFCLVVPLVWVVRLLPVSLNGIGVGEGAFVYLLGLFSVPKGQALALALVLLGLQSSVALLGGLLLIVRMVRRTKPSNSATVSLDIADVPVALLAGGLATRLRPITATVPKALVEVAGRPFIEHQLELLKRNGIRRVVLCLGHLGEQVEAHLGDGSALGMELQYAYDGSTLRGTGGAVRGALPQLGEVFWVMYGDSYMDIDYRAVLDDFAGRNGLGLMTVLQNGNRWDTSNVVFQDGRLLRYDKRTRLPEMTHIDYGVALLRREALERIPPDQPYDLADLYRDLVAEGRMVGHEVTERFYEIGSPHGLEETRLYLQRGAA